MEEYYFHDADDHNPSLLTNELSEKKSRTRITTGGTQTNNTTISPFNVDDLTPRDLQHDEPLGSSSKAMIKNTNKEMMIKKKKCFKSNISNKKKTRGALKLSTDPQSVAARERRHRISDRFKILQSMFPGGAKMDTVTMLEEAIHYVKFLKTQIWLHQNVINYVDVLLPHDQACHGCTFPYSQQNINYNNSLLCLENKYVVEDRVQESPHLNFSTNYYEPSLQGKEATTFGDTAS